MESIKNINFKGKKVLIRVDFNVPLNENLEVSDITRIISSIPTIEKVIRDNGKAILISHLGRPEKKTPSLSLNCLVNTLSFVTKKDIIFIDDCIGNEVLNKINKSPFGSIILLENLRFHKEELNGDKNFAKELSKLGDVYINDAFGVCHRKNTSIYNLPKLFNEKYMGYLLEKEVYVINKILKENEKPLTAIIGGSKVSSKLPIINNLINSVDNIIIGGGMAYTFSKAMGGKIGNSLVEDKLLDTCLDILKISNSKGIKIYLPTDSIVSREFNNYSPTKNIKINEIPDDHIGLDIGNETIEIFSEVIKNSKTILWNGPMGVFEMSNFANGTKQIGNAIISATKKGSFSLVGGGDSVAAVKLFHMDKDMSYVSTGGGAMLEALEGKILPGVEVFI